MYYILPLSHHVVFVFSWIFVAAVAYLVALYVPGWLYGIFTRILDRLTKRRSGGKIPYANESVPAVTKELDFPSDWWTSQKLFQLEKRAIFSKTWLHVCHSSLFKQAGDYRTFSIADFRFIVVLGKDRQLRAFHNVCRHRAHTVATKSGGSCLVLRCRYHGWSYDTCGKLIKAPKFDEVSDFDRSQNGLFEVRTFIDSSGFVYVNFDVYGSDGLTIRVGVPIRARLGLVESWSTEANFNWKIAVLTGAFRISSLTRLNRLAVFISNALGFFESWKWPVEFELSPLTRLMRSTSGEQWLTITIVPMSKDKSCIQCSLYSSKPDLKAGVPVSAVKQEVKDSIGLLERIFIEASGSFSNPDTSSQEPLLAEMRAHSRLERLVGKEVHPASRLRETSEACKVADDLCRELEMAGGVKSAGNDNDALAW